MFCEEPIIAAYEGRPDYDGEGDAFFDCYHDLAYHVTAGYRIILETEHFYMFLSVDGVKISNKIQSIEELEEDGEWIASFIQTDHLDPDEPPWVYYEATLFIGERLTAVKSANDIFLLDFDHFQLKIIPHDLKADDVPFLLNADHWSYNHVYGVERFIKKKCSCGGSGELLMDFVSDYVVRCKECKRSTWAQMTVIGAIEEWEAGEIHCDASEITIE